MSNEDIMNMLGPEQKLEALKAKIEKGGDAPAVKKPETLGQKAEILLSKLFENGDIVKLHVGKWEGKKKFTHKDLKNLGMADELPDEVFMLGKKRLLQKSAFEAINLIEAKARRLIDDNSTESWVPGLRYMTSKMADSVIAELKDIEKEYMAEAEKFAKKYPTLRQQMLDAYPKYRKLLEPHYPSPERVQASFRFQVDRFQITIARRETSLLEDVKIEIQQDLEKKLDGFYTASVSGLRGKFIEELQGVQAKLTAGDKVHGKTIKKIQKMIDQAKGMEVVSDKEFFAHLDTLKADLAKINEDEFQKQVQEKLANTIAEAKKDNVGEVVNEFKRSVLL